MKYHSLGTLLNVGTVLGTSRLMSPEGRERCENCGRGAAPRAVIPVPVGVHSRPEDLVGLVEPLGLFVEFCTKGPANGKE